MGLLKGKHCHRWEERKLSPFRKELCHFSLERIIPEVQGLSMEDKVFHSYSEGESSAGGVYYRVARGRCPGVCDSWADASVQVNGFSNCSFKMFKSRTNAEDFV